MQDYQEAMLKSLVAVAWADGRVEADEHEVIEALLSAFEVSAEDAQHIRDYARAPRTLEDIPLSDLSASDRRVLLQHAVILTYIDGAQTEKEKEVLASLVTKLRVPEDEASQILADADVRARRLLSLLL
jgi:tellurite resistance protein